MRCHAKYDHRLQEWYYALAATSYGMGLLHPQTSMASSAYSRLLSWGSENVWGAASVMRSYGIGALDGLTT